MLYLIMSKEAIKKFTSTKDSYMSIFKHSIVSGVGWSFGVTFGFILISTILVFGFRKLGGLPVVGSWIASVVEVTQIQLESRTPVFREPNQ